MCIQLANIYLGQYASCFIYSFEFHVISEKTLCCNNFTSPFERQFCMEKVVTINPANLLLQISYKIAFTYFLSSRRIQKQESHFWRIGGGLVTRNISAFYLQLVASYFKAMSNSIDFFKGIFFHVIHNYITVPCYRSVFMKASGKSS